MVYRYVQVNTAVDDEECARKIAGLLIRRKLAACVQTEGPVTSVYRWKGKVEKAKEWRLVIKTRASLYGKVEKCIRENHPYEVPEIVALPLVAGTKDYLAWIGNSTD